MKPVLCVAIFLGSLVWTAFVARGCADCLKAGGRPVQGILGYECLEARR